MANRQLNAIITIGGTVSAGLKSAIGSTRTNLSKLGDTVRDLEREQSKLGKGLQNSMRGGGPLTKMHTEYRAITGEIIKARREQERLTRAQRGINKGRAMMGEAVAAVGAIGATVATLGLPVIQAAQFETAMLGVAKQVDGARDKNGQLTKTYYDMAKGIQMLGREVPITTNKLAAMAEQGARQGVAKGDLLGFTRQVAIMGTALQLPEDELAENMGKIANLYKIPIANIAKLGDTINYLDDNAISKGGDIIEFLTRTGGVAGSVKVTGSNMAALGSTLLSLGERTETAGTATNALFQKLAAADKGSKTFQRGLADIGVSARDMQRGMQIDAQGTVLQLIDAVNKLPEEKRLGALVDIVGLEHSDTIAKLASNVGEYRKQIELAGSQKAEGSMGREFAAQLATTNAQWEITKNRTREVGVNIGSVLLPAVNQFFGVIGRATSAMADFSREHPTLTKNILLTVGAVVGGVAAFNSAKFVFGAVTKSLGVLRVAMATNPVGLALLGIGTAAVLIYENWKPIKAFFMDVWSGIQSGAKAAWSFITDYILPFTPLGPIVQNWKPISEFFGSLWGGIKTAAGMAWEFTKTIFLNATPLGFVVKNWGPLSSFFGGLFDNIKSIVGSAIDWVMGKIARVGDAWNATKRFFGFNAGEPAKPSNMWKFERAAPPPPSLPKMRGTGGQAYNDNRKTEIHVTQQPGENGKAFADRTVRQLAANDRRQGSAALFDQPRGY